MPRSTLGFSATPTSLLRSLAPAASAAAVVPDLGWDVALWMFTADGSDRWPVFPVSARFGHDQVMNGQATLSLPVGDDVVARYQGATLGEEFPGIILRAFRRGRERPIWTGPVITTRFATRGAGGVVDITCEHIWQHIHRRRAALDLMLAAQDWEEEADNIGLKLQRANIGPSPVVPGDHPGTRTDFGGWSAAVASDHSPALAPSRRFVEQSGNSLLDLVNGLYEAADLRPVLTDALGLAPFTINNDYPFQDNDLTDRVVFGQYHGNLEGFELTSDRGALANIWAVEGKTANTPQWVSDSASITLWGEYEAYAQKPEDDAVNAALLQSATDLRDGYGPARITYKAGIIETPGHRFGEDWFWADRIRLEDAVFGIYAEQTVRAWEVEMADGLVRRVDVVLGVPRVADLQRHVTGFVGMPGSRFGGSPWRNRRQT